MKNLILPLTSLLLFTLTACTSDEKMLKNKAEEMAQKKFEQVTRQEAEESLSQSPWLQQAYIDFIRDSAEVTVKEVKFQSETLATAAVVVKTYPVKFRRLMLSVAAKVDASKSRRFSFGEARSLLSQQAGGKVELIEQPFGVYKFHKSGSDWVVE